MNLLCYNRNHEEHKPCGALMNLLKPSSEKLLSRYQSPAVF